MKVRVQSLKDNPILNSSCVYRTINNKLGQIEPEASESVDTQLLEAQSTIERLAKKYLVRSISVYTFKFSVCILYMFIHLAQVL